MEGNYDSSLTFGVSLKLQCLIGLQDFEFFNFNIIFTSWYDVSHAMGFTGWAKFN